MLADCGLQHEASGVMTCFFTLCHLHHKCSAGSHLLHFRNPIYNRRGKSKLVSTCIQESNQIILQDWTAFIHSCKKHLTSAEHLFNKSTCTSKHSIVSQEVTDESDRMWEWQDFIECRCGQRQDADRKYSRPVHLCSAGCAPHDCKH